MMCSGTYYRSRSVLNLVGTAFFTRGYVEWVFPTLRNPRQDSVIQGRRDGLCGTTR